VGGIEGGEQLLLAFQHGRVQDENIYEVAVEPGHPARSKCPATVALSSLRDSRKLALRAQTVRLPDASFRQEPQRFEHIRSQAAPAQLLFFKTPV